jgi:chromosome segregation ATPase
MSQTRTHQCQGKNGTCSNNVSRGNIYCPSCTDEQKGNSKQKRDLELSNILLQRTILEEEVSRLRNENTQLNNKLNSQTNASGNCLESVEYKTLKEKYDILEEKYTKMESQTNNLQKYVQQLEQEITQVLEKDYSSQKQIAELTSECTRLKLELEKHQTSIELSKIGQVMTEINSLSST